MGKGSGGGGTAAPEAARSAADDSSGGSPKRFATGLSSLVKQGRRLSKSGSFVRHNKKKSPAVEAEALRGSEFRSSLYTIESSTEDTCSRQGSMSLLEVFGDRGSEGRKTAQAKDPARPSPALAPEDESTEEKKVDEPGTITPLTETMIGRTHTIQVVHCRDDLAVSALTTSQLHSVKTLEVEDDLAEGLAGITTIHVDQSRRDMAVSALTTSQLHSAKTLEVEDDLAEEGLAGNTTIEVDHSRREELAVSALTTSQLHSAKTLEVEDDNEDDASLDLCNIEVRTDFEPEVSALDMGWHMSSKLCNSELTTKNGARDDENTGSASHGIETKSILHRGINSREPSMKTVSFNDSAENINTSGTPGPTIATADEVQTNATSRLKRRSRPENEERALACSFVTAVTSVNALHGNVHDVRSSCPPVFATATTQPGNRQSDLVAPKSSLNPSWFASRGMMSQKSFKRYKQEMREGVLRQVNSGSDVRAMDRKSRGTVAEAKVNRDHTAGTDRRHSESDLLRAKQNPKRFSRSASLNSGLGQWVESCLSSMEEFSDEEKSAAFANLIQSMLSQPIQKDARLSCDEVAVLHKMIRRLSLTNIDDGSDFNSTDNSIAESDEGEGNVQEGNDLAETLDRGSEIVHVVSESSAHDSINDEAHAHAHTMTPVGQSGDQRLDLPSMVPDQSSSEEENLLQPETTVSALVNERMATSAEKKNGLSVRQDSHRSISFVKDVADPAGDPVVNTDVPSPVQDDSEETGMSATAKPQRLSRKKISNADILSEGLGHLFMTVTVNMYGKLREMSILGHASVKLADIDVNSHQSLARKKELKRLGLFKPEEDTNTYLDNAKSTRSIVEIVSDATFSHDLCAYRALHLGHATHVYDGSLLDNFKSMATLVDTDFEVVWFSDWHPSDVIYCICVNRYTATVTVVFHGKETAFRRTKNAAMMEHSNPIMYEVYADNCDVINLRAEISEELLRARKDNGQTIIDEVRQRVDTIGKELNGGARYQLTVTGHSLGGALATVAGFYLAADFSQRLKLSSAVKVYTFGASRVGCEKFQQSFRHLENTGRLQHARFTNSNEFIGPFWDPRRSWSVDDWYRHVGMNIRLHANSAQSLDIKYNQGAGMFAEMSALIKSYLCRSTGNAGISEYQHRLHSSREDLVCQRGAGGRDKKTKCTLSLDELYSMKESFTGEGNKAKGGYSLPIYILISFFIALEIALLLRFAGGTINGGF